MGKGKAVGKKAAGKKAAGKQVGKQKTRSNTPMCLDMIKNGSCPRGESCKYCLTMVEKFGTNDWTDPECWNVRMNGECTMEYCKWCPDKPDPSPGMGKGKSKG